MCEASDEVCISVRSRLFFIGEKRSKMAAPRKGQVRSKTTKDKK